MRNRSIRCTTVAALALSLGLALAACGDNGDNAARTEDDKPAGTTQTSPEGIDTPSPSPNQPGALDDVTAAGLQAIATAEAHGDGVAYSIDFDDDNTWEVEVAAGNRTIEVEVDVAGTEVLNTGDDDLDDDRRGLDDAQISITEAIERVIAGTGGVLDDADLDDDDHWSVTVDLPDRDDVDYRVDTGNGEVTEEEDDD